jgi:hypothetical protein
MKSTSYLLLFLALWSCQNKADLADKIIDPVFEAQVDNARLSLATTDSLLAESFRWAAQQAMAYVHDGSDPVGLWYEAALPRREAFCMRDVAHQSTGAQLLGLAAHNKNMLRKFAENISETKDWCSYWEINRYDLPAPVDYRNDKEFWYNLPANYDVLDACYRQYLWTGDPDYLEDAQFVNFYERSIEDYTARWQLGLNDIRHRERWLNTPQPLDSTDYFHIARGLPSYEEGNPITLQVGADLLGFQYRAYLSWANMLDLTHNKDKAAVQRHRAEKLQQYFVQKWLNDSTKTFYQARFSDQGFVTRPSQFLLYTGIAHTDHLYKKEVARLVNFGKTNIESQSYLPLILFRYDENKAAYEHILDLSAPEKERRQYPEVSFAVIEAIVCGLAGVQAYAGNQQITTLNRLPDEKQQINLNNIPVFGGEVTVSHISPSSSSLENNTGNTVYWKAEFYGNHEFILINGTEHKAQHELTLGDQEISFVVVPVKNKSSAKGTLRE